MSKELENNNISLLNWNIFKGKRKGWQEDLQTFSKGIDLLLIQEAILDAEMLNALKQDFFYEFSKGFSTRSMQSGVLTACKVKPVYQQSLRVLEPLIRTPKSILITKYQLKDSDKTLLVGNIHAINFCFGTLEFRSQLWQLYSTLLTHDGPVILSGDFNTWHQQRIDIVFDFADKLDLNVVDFLLDSRKVTFGNPLDFVFYRGLNANMSVTMDVRSSDHNPLIVSFDMAA